MGHFYFGYYCCFTGIDIFGFNCKLDKGLIMSLRILYITSLFILACADITKYVTYEGEIYETVVIDKQVWFKRNLNYMPTDSSVAHNSKCYENDDDNCVKYGRLYSWTTAMALPENCNELYCSNLTKTPHKGICPKGWHIPANADWDKLLLYVNGSSKHLKSKNDWNDHEGASGNGEDSHGFTALPGGVGYPEGFYNMGNSGYWWSSSEISNTNASRRGMYHDNDSIGYYSYGKTLLLSVRCLKD